MIDLMNLVGSLGVGALLAIIIFLMYRKDRQTTEKMWRESKKFTEDRLTEIIEADQASREDHTKALTELIVLLRNINGKH